MDLVVCNLLNKLTKAADEISSAVFISMCVRYGLRHLRVERNELRPFFRHVILVKNGVRGTNRRAQVAVDTGFGIDVEHLLALVKTLGGAAHHAFLMFATKTGSGNDVSHLSPLC